MKRIIGIIYGLLSAAWLYFSILFSSAVWLEGTGSYNWKEDSVFIPIGIIMFVMWIISFIVFVLVLKSKKKRQNER